MEKPSEERELPEEMPSVNAPRGPSAPVGARQDPDLDRMASWLKPLGSPIRLRLLRFLTRPHYLEEVASALHLSRQAARKHVDKLVNIGVLERKSGVRDSGAVTEYVINPQALFLIYDEFEKMGALRRSERDDLLVRTRPEPGRAVTGERALGPCFTIVRGFGMGQRIALTPEAKREWVIGRDHRCDFAVPHDPYASNRQAEVTYDGARFVLTDLRSTNGTEHNWNLLARGATVELRHGDLVGIGKTLLLFWDAPERAR